MLTRTAVLEIPGRTIVMTDRTASPNREHFGRRGCPDPRPSWACARGNRGELLRGPGERVRSGGYRRRECTRRAFQGRGGARGLLSERCAEDPRHSGLAERVGE